MHLRQSNIVLTLNASFKSLFMKQSSKQKGHSPMSPLSLPLKLRGFLKLQEDLIQGYSVIIELGIFKVYQSGSS